MPGRILVVEDETANRSLLLARLRGACYEALAVSDARAAQEIARAEQPDLALVSTAPGQLDGIGLCRRLKTDPATRHIPIVLLTRRNTPEARLRGLEAGADDFLPLPVSDLELFARVRNLVRMKIMLDELRLRDETAMALQAPRPEHDEPPPLVAILCADAEHARARAALLQAESRLRVHLPADERALLNDWDRRRPDALILERDLGPGRDGLRLIPELRARAATRHTAILLLVRRDDLEGAAAGLDLGANDYLAMPCDGDELAARLASQLRRKRVSDRLRATLRSGLALAITDPLTGLYNRRYAESHLQRLTEAAAATGAPLAVMLLDLDRFKSVNDRYGHAAGDEVLVEFSRRLRDNLRNVDMVARMGGEEFLVAMPEADETAAATVAERIRRAVEERPFPISAPPGALTVTVSAGLIVTREELPAARGLCAPPAGAAAAQPGLAEEGAGRITPPGAQAGGFDPRELPRALLDGADRALYLSKNAGRNRVTAIRAA